MAFMRLLVLLVAYMVGQSPGVTHAFERGLLTIETQTGNHRFVIDLADTPDDRRIGLMGRTDISPGYGMLFDFRGHERVAMWMKNTPTSLDMIFIDGAGEVVGIVPNTTPFSTDIIQVDKPVAAVLEVVAGTAQTLGMMQGDIVRHALFEAP